MYRPMFTPPLCYINSPAHTRRAILIVVCGLLCLTAGCEKKPVPQQSSRAEQNNVISDIPECKNGSKNIDNKCVCEDGTELLGDSWFCLSDGQRCYGKDGCTVGNKHCAAGANYRKGEFDYCPDKPNTDKSDSNCLEKYTEYFYSNNTWNSFTYMVNKCEDYERSCDEDNEEERKVCESLHIKREITYCGGIPGNALQKDGKTTGDYKCRYNRWVCNNLNGCNCFDGYETKTIHLGDFCENKIITKSLPDKSLFTTDCIDWANIESDEAKYLLTDSGCKLDYYCAGSVDRSKLCKDCGSPDSKICLEDSCPCGDGYCMKFGTCSDGICSCYNIKSNNYGEFICNNYYAQWPTWTGGDYCPNESEGILICNKEGGCHTMDGRHYPQNATIGHNSFSDLCLAGESISYNRFNKKIHDDSLAYRESLMFHIDAGFDTTIESISTLGECVLDRTDSIQRWTEIRNNDPVPAEYICDESSCTCMTQTCKIGEICRAGECVADSCNAHEKSMPVCSVNINNGYLELINPLKTSECINIAEAAKVREKLDEIEYDICGIELFDDEGEIEAAKNEILQPESHPAEKYFDVIKCEGGHRYCHGKNNKPIRIPDNPKGWECRGVTTLPDNDKHTDLKAWVCMNKSGCTCGDTICEYSKTCLDNQCIEAPLSVIDCQGIPLEDGYRCVFTENGMFNQSIREIGMACDQKECTCGNSVCIENEICRNGRCIVGEKEKNPYVTSSHLNKSGDFVIRSKYDPKLYCANKSGCKCNGESIEFGDYCESSMPCYGDGRMDENGCFCGDTKLNDVQNETCLHYHDRYYVLCNHPEGCLCGETKCPMSSYCSQGQCIDPLTEKPIEKTSVKLGLATPCADKQCPCGNSACKIGQFCYGSSCHDEIYANILHEKRYFYDERGVKIEKNVYDPVFDWNYIQSYDMSKFNPDNLPLDEYGFIPYYNTYTECCGGQEDVFEKGELRCMLDSGCVCGDHSCPWGAQCNHGECVYDNSMSKWYCPFDGYSSIKYTGSSCECNGTNIPSDIFNPKREYDCERSGWECTEHPGCDCGDKRCAPGAYCVRPGVCTEYISENVPNQ